MMMPPVVMTTMTTAIPAVVVAATAVMAPPMPMPTPMAASDLNNGLVDSAEHRGCRCRHGGCRHGWRKYKSTAGKSDYQKPFHWCLLVANGSRLSVPFLQC